MTQNPYESPREMTHDGPVRLSEASVAFYSIGIGFIVLAVSIIAVFTFYGWFGP